MKPTKSIYPISENYLRYANSKYQLKVRQTKYILDYFESHLSFDAFIVFRCKYSYPIDYHMRPDSPRCFYEHYHQLITDTWDFEELVADIQEEFDITGYITVLDEWEDNSHMDDILN